jgi:hypothetical protein
MTRCAALCGVGLLVAAALLAGCAVGTAPDAPGWTAVPITDVKSVAGKWEGQLTRGHGPRDDWMEITIREDGTYELVSFRTIGVLRGNGRVAVDGGKLRAQGERGTATLALATRGADRRLDVTMRTAEGADLRTTLVPKR